MTCLKSLTRLSPVTAAASQTEVLITPPLPRCFAQEQNLIALLMTPSEYRNLFRFHLTFVFFRYINELKQGNISDEDWPIFCYENEACDPDNLEKGLFRGIYLLRVHISFASFRRLYLMSLEDFSSHFHWTNVCDE
jgi:hypothetical protein